MKRKNITIKNVDLDVADRLKTIRELERRQLAEILADALAEYWSAAYDEDQGEDECV